MLFVVKINFRLLNKLFKFDVNTKNVNVKKLKKNFLFKVKRF